VDTEGLVLMTLAMSANVTDRDGIKLLLGPSCSGPQRAPVSRASRTCLWLGTPDTPPRTHKGAGWVQRTLWALDGREIVPTRRS
jgi:hypothetical protein